MDNLLQNRAGKRKADYVPEDGTVIAYEKGDVLIGNIRPYLKKIWLAEYDGGTNGDVLVVHTKDKEIALSEFLYHILASDDFFVYDMHNSKGAKMPRGDKNAIMQYQFTLPTIEEQQRIVSILTRFDKLYNDITEGLPAEIEVRQKQYEYYRDKLLTFEENKIYANH